MPETAVGPEKHMESGSFSGMNPVMAVIIEYTWIAQEA
jgi:hypothetical protein